MGIYYNIKAGTREYLVPNEYHLQTYAIENILNRHRIPSFMKPQYTATDSETGRIIPLELKLKGTTKEGRWNYVITDEESVHVEFDVTPPLLPRKNTLFLGDGHTKISWNLDTMAELACILGDYWPNSIKSHNDAIVFIAGKLRDCLESVNGGSQEDPGSCLEGAQQAADIILTLDMFKHLNLSLLATPPQSTPIPKE